MPGVEVIAAAAVGADIRKRPATVERLVYPGVRCGRRGGRVVLSTAKARVINDPEEEF